MENLENRNTKVVTSLLLCAIFFLATFIGNYAYDDVLVGPFFISFSMLCLIFSGRAFHLSGALISLGFSFFLGFSYLLNYDFEYYKVFYFFLTYSLYLSVMLLRKADLEVGAIYFFSVVAAFFLIGLVLSGGYIGGRASFIFGPNNLYRIFGVCLVFVLFSGSGKNGIGSALRYLSIAICCLGVAITGSRGGLVVIAAIFAIFILVNLRRIRMKEFVLFCFFLPPLLLYIYEKIDQTRILNFSGDLESIAVRLDAYRSLSYFFEKDGYSIMMGYPRFKELTYIMPHNLFLEVLLAYGLIFFMVVFFGFALYFYFLMRDILKRGPEGYCLDLSLVVIFIGAMFSGTLYDNYPALMISVLGYVYLGRVLIKT